MSPTKSVESRSAIEKVQAGLLSHVRDEHKLRKQQGLTFATSDARSYIEKNLERKRSVSSAEKKTIIERILDEVFGFGPIGPFLRDPAVRNIYIEGPENAYVEMPGKGRGNRDLTQVKLSFRDEQHLLEIIQRFLSPLGGELTPESPTFNGVMPNGVRFYATLPPVSPHGPTLALIMRHETRLALAVVPHWDTTVRYASQIPLVQHQQRINQSNNSVGSEGNNGGSDCGILFRMQDELSDAYLSQAFPARSFRDKQIIFTGIAERLSGTTPDAAKRNFTCLAKTEAFDRNGKCIAIDQNQILDWTGQMNFETKLQVPQNAVWLQLTVHIRGAVELWLSDLNFITQKSGKPTTRTSRGPLNLKLAKKV